jgi:hypothetical protein
VCFKVDWFTANTPGSVKGVASFRIASLRFRLCGYLYIPSDPPSSPSCLTHRCVHHQPLQLNNMKCSFCNLAFCCLAFVFHLSLLAPGRSAGTASRCSRFVLHVPLPSKTSRWYTIFRTKVESIGTHLWFFFANSASAYPHPGPSSSSIIDAMCACMCTAKP